ncbi:MAG: tRNA (adenosine(37)-N6)-dimethylallyltransferase MiaA [Candidatus Binataceae bacterium]|nr:tRNA (adenosine(37)-N6)-dimethylallyltransferase MiaA [Candidatus Binataceae bacterium]
MSSEPHPTNIVKTGEELTGKVCFIVGPTGSGKSALAIEIAGRLDAEIVNADSRLFFAGVDIGSAKPSAQERARVPHHLIDCLMPHDRIDAAIFATQARAAIADIVRRGRRPIVVGGSGLYLRALKHGFFDGPPASPQLRAELRALAQTHGVAELHRELAAVDPASAARIGPHDLARIVRALEVFRLTGEPISVHQQRHRFAARTYDTLTIAIDLDRAELYRRINLRFAQMLADGLIEELCALIEAGYDPGAEPLSTIGYRQLSAYLRHEMTLAEAVEQAKRATRNLAKRQLTWFRHEPDIVWLPAAEAAARGIARFSDFFESQDSGGISIARLN